VEDYDVEVAQEARIADPVPGVAYAGLFGNVRATWTGSRTYRVRLDLRVSAFSEGIRVISTGMAAFGPVQSLPVQTRQLSTSLDLAGDEEKTIDLGTDPFDSEAQLIATVKIVK
jgi:hypothetical protein